VSGWERQFSVSMPRTAARLLARLPSLWRTRRAARRLVPTLPRYEGSLTTPSADLLFSWIEGLCQTPHRRPGTAEGRLGEQWVADQMASLGLEGVTQDPIPIDVWEADQWSLLVADEPISSFFVPGTGTAGPAEVTAPLVYVGTGRRREFLRADVAGRIVVAEVPFPRLPTGLLIRGAGFALSDPQDAVGWTSSQVLNFVRHNFLGGAAHADEAPVSDVYWQAQRRGAAGIALILRDQPSNTASHYGPYDGLTKPMPGLWVGQHDGRRLRRMARGGETATLTLEATTRKGEMNNVWGVLPGTSDDVILITSHHDSPHRGAVEDGAGVAQVLAQAWAWSRVPRGERPCTLVFVVGAGHFHGSEGGFAFARRHPDLMARAKILITLEHLAAREVRERGEQYEPTGRSALSVLFTTPRPRIVAVVMRTLAECPVPASASIPADLFGPAPTSDAVGYVLQSGVPVISWIGCPYYLLDEHDTPDKVDPDLLEPVCEAVTELVKTFMVY
jgi:hypothetical protein